MHRTWLWLAALCLVLAACHGTSSYSNSYTYFELGQTLEGDRGLIARRAGDDTVQIAVYRDGRLLGAEGVDDEMARMIPGDERRWVDHPKLPDWQRRLEEADRLATSPEARPEYFIETLEPIPFRQLVARYLLRYAADDPARAVEVLDALGDLVLGRDDTTELLGIALADESLDAERLARWLRQGTVGRHAEAALLILEAPAAGDETCRAALATLDHFYGSQRRTVYEAAGRPLAPSDSDAGLLVNRISCLYGSDRRKAALLLLEDPSASRALAFQLVEGIDTFYGSDRLKVFLAAARRIVADPEARSPILGRIQALYGSARREAALAVISWPETPPILAGGFAGVIDKFYGSSRARVLEAVIESPGFTGEAQRECVNAARKVYGRDRRRIMVKIANSPRATADTKARANALLIHE